MITPFHFACFCEERLLAQFEILDPALGSFIQIFRRFSLTEDRATLQFGAKTSAGEEFVPRVTLILELILQKGDQTALNCFLDCPDTKAQKSFRLLLNEPDEAEPQILKILAFLQKAFLPLGYTTTPNIADTPAATAPISEDTASTTLETAKDLMSSAGTATQPDNIDSLTPDAAALTRGKKYIFEKEVAQGEAVKLRTHDGKYVPDGELPATLRIIK